jgi:HPt (histidine-containing phosphotransfer) domain-containing protein
MNQPPTLLPLIEILGEASAKRFLSVALPQIQEYRHTLLSSLQQQDWQTASDLAHRFKATAHLYSSEALQTYLERVLTQAVSTQDLPTFLPRMEQELLDIETSITAYLASPP